MATGMHAFQLKSAGDFHVVKNTIRLLHALGQPVLN
jgi:hypothetical protein